MRSAWNSIVAEMGGTFLFFFVGIGARGDTRSSGRRRHGDRPGGRTGGGRSCPWHRPGRAGQRAGGGQRRTFQPGGDIRRLDRRSDTQPRRALAYVIAQLIGAILAGLAVRAVIPASISPGLGTPALGSGIEPLGGIIVETVLTVILLIAVFGTAVDPRGPKIGGLAIGFAVGADILMGGPLTGAAMNPARWFGPAAVTGAWDTSYVWIIGPLLGAAIVALAYR